MTNHKRTEMLTAEEELDLLTKFIEHGDLKARDKVIHHYKPLAHRRARDYANRSPRGRETLNDLRQEAVLGLTEAVERFKLGKNSRVSTFARFYIDSRLFHYTLSFHSSVRVGTSSEDKRIYTHLPRKLAAIEALNGRAYNDADLAQIAEELDVKLSSIHRMMQWIFTSDYSVAGTDANSEGNEDRGAMSLPATYGNQESVENTLDVTRIMTSINNTIEKAYDGRDLEIVRARLTSDKMPSRIKELSEKYNITNERVRQIQREGMSMIRENLSRSGINSIADISIGVDAD